MGIREEIRAKDFVAFLDYQREIPPKPYCSKDEKEDNESGPRIPQINALKIFNDMEKIYNNNFEKYLATHPGWDVLFAMKGIKQKKGGEVVYQIATTFYKNSKELNKIKKDKKISGQIYLSKPIPNSNETQIPLLVKPLFQPLYQVNSLFKPVPNTKPKNPFVNVYSHNMENTEKNNDFQILKQMRGRYNKKIKQYVKKHPGKYVLYTLMGEYGIRTSFCEDEKSLKKAKENAYRIYNSISWSRQIPAPKSLPLLVQKISND